MRTNPQDAALALGEAKKAFGNDAVFLEKYIEEPHHIEFQVVADNTAM